MSLDLNEYLENTIAEVGGMGRFQWILVFLVLGSKVSIGFSTLMMAFGGSTPDWYCNWNSIHGENYTTKVIKKCNINNTSQDWVCSTKTFEPDMKTVVSEWDLVCDREWITATITTIQMGGLLVGGFISGQIADTFGRKLTYFLSLSILLIFNAIAAFSTSWRMFATLRFFIGIGCGFYTTVFFTFLIEFIPRKSRSMVISIPSWPLWAIVFSLLCWWLHDWKFIQIATAVATIPWFIGIKFVPESYRWLVANGRVKEAYAIMTNISRWNGRSEPKWSEFDAAVAKHTSTITENRYTILDVLKDPDLLKTTFFLAIPWIACGYGYYAISFGVQQLSGNLYVNLMLISAMDIVSICVWYFSNCIGRKWTTFAFFLLGGFAGIVVGVVQFVDLADKGKLVNGFSLTSKLCVSCGWAGLMLLTSESYPTVVRNIGFGIHNSVTRVGAMIAPQLVYASNHVPGLSYLLFGGLMLLSAFCALAVKETKNLSLKDTLETAQNNTQSLKDKNQYVHHEKQLKNAFDNDMFYSE